jgi:hypothetical protein
MRHCFDLENESPEVIAFKAVRKNFFESNDFTGLFVGRSVNGAEPTFANFVTDFEVFPSADKVGKH